MRASLASRNVRSRSARSGLTTSPTRADPSIASTSRQHVRAPLSDGLLYPVQRPPAADPISLINAIHERNMKAGVAISPDTLSTEISDEVADAADMLLVMTVYPGACPSRHGPSPHDA